MSNIRENRLLGNSNSFLNSVDNTLRKLTDPNKDQAAALDGRAGYILEFHGVLDFKEEVELPFSQELARQSAVFFTSEKDGYQRCQVVMIDQALPVSILHRWTRGWNISSALMCRRRLSRTTRLLSVM